MWALDYYYYWAGCYKNLQCICLSIFLFFVFTWKLMLRIILQWTVYLDARGRGRELQLNMQYVRASCKNAWSINVWYFHLLTCTSTCKWKLVDNARKKPFILVNLPSLKVICVKWAEVKLCKVANIYVDICKVHQTNVCKISQLCRGISC